MIKTTVIDLITKRLPEDAATYPTWTIRCTWGPERQGEPVALSHHAAADERSAQGLARLMLDRYQHVKPRRVVRAEIRQPDGSWTRAEPSAGGLITPFHLAIRPRPRRTRVPRATSGGSSRTQYASPRLDVRQARCASPAVALRLDGDRLRKARVGLGLSQEDFARAVRAAGAAIGEPNGCTKRAVQRWESAGVGLPRPHLRRALEAVTRLPFGALCEPASHEPDPAAAELSEIAADMHDLICRLANVRGRLAPASPEAEC